jgi:hypothetical protein
MTSEDEFAFTPFVSYAFVHCDGSDTLGVVVAVAYVFVEEDGAVKCGDDQAVPAGKYNVSGDTIDSGALNGHGIAFVARAEIEFADEFAAVEVPEEYAAVERRG